MVRASERIGPGELAYVDPEAELIFVRPGLPAEVEDEVLRQATAGMLGRWDLAPDTLPAQRTKPHLRLVTGDDDAGVG